MGTWKTGGQALDMSASRTVADYHAAQRQAQIDADLPPIERPCGTPGAVYSITVKGCDLKCAVHLPFNIAAAVPKAAHEDMKKALHDAVLPIVEKFYRDVWDKTIAGKYLGDDPVRMPKRWEGLFTKYIKRCFQRGERALIEGRWRDGHYDQLPLHYKGGPDD
jgi:hypothetical protein